MQTLNPEMSTKTHLMNLKRPLTGSQADEVEHKLREIVAGGGKRIILNLEDVPFIDRRGLAALITGAKLLGRDLQLVAPQIQPRLLFELTGFDRIFHITDRPTSMVA